MLIYMTVINAEILLMWARKSDMVRPEHSSSIETEIVMPGVVHCL